MPPSLPPTYATRRVSKQATLLGKGIPGFFSIGKLLLKLRLTRLRRKSGLVFFFLAMKNVSMNWTNLSRPPTALKMGLREVRWPQDKLLSRGIDLGVVSSAEASRLPSARDNPLGVGRRVKRLDKNRIVVSDSRVSQSTFTS